MTTRRARGKPRGGVLAARARSVEASATFAIAEAARAMRARGLSVIEFGAGEPDGDTPDEIKQAAIQALHDGFTRYTPAAGIDELKDAVVATLRRRHRLEYDRQDVVISCGAKHSLYNLSQVLFEPGDEVLIPAPYWVSYPDQVRLAGATPVIVTTHEREGFLLTRAAAERALTDRTKALILNTPSNPTGAVYDEPTLRALADLAVARDLIIISDEIYDAFVYDGARHVSIATLGPEIKARTVIVNGVSKRYAMTGWRIGYAAGPRAIMAAVAAVQSQSTSNPNSIAQKAAVAALNGSQESVRRMVAEFAGRRRRMLDGLRAIDGMTCTAPAGAFYLFPRVAAFFGRTAEDGWTIKGSEDLAAYLVEAAGVTTIPGRAFGADEYLRLSYAVAPAAITEGLARMAAALKKLTVMSRPRARRA